MYYLFLSLILLVLFYLLGRFADIVVINIRKLGENIGLKVFFLGIIVGFFTNLPEISLGVNALIDNLPELALGNLFGGVVVILTLILGGSIIINRKISTQEIIKEITPILLFVLLPILLGLKGSLGLFDGLLIIAAYILLIYYLFKKNNRLTSFGLRIVNRLLVVKKIFYILIGLILVLVTSNLVINVAEKLLAHFNLSEFIIGLLFFSIGTNLPEITLVFRSWHRRVEDLSLSTLLGSAMSHALLIGVFVSIKKVYLPIDRSYIFLLLIYIIIFSLLIIFSRTHKNFSRLEGVVLLAVYLLFFCTQIYFFLIN